MRSDTVVLPASMWEMMPRLRIRAMAVMVGRGRDAPESGGVTLADQVERLHVEVVELEVFALQFLDVEAVEAAVVEEILAQGDVALGHDPRQEVVEVDRLLLDVDHHVAE